MGTKKTTTKKTSVKKSPLGTPLGNPLKFFREGGDKRKAMFKHGGYNVPKNGLPKKFMGGPDDNNPSSSGNSLYTKDANYDYNQSLTKTKKNPFTGRTTKITDFQKTIDPGRLGGTDESFRNDPSKGPEYLRLKEKYNRKGELINNKVKNYGMNKPRNFNTTANVNMNSMTPQTIEKGKPYTTFNTYDDRDEALSTAYRNPAYNYETSLEDRYNVYKGNTAPSTNLANNKKGGSIKRKPTMKKVGLIKRKK
jgi:hypothetical protein